MPEEKKELKVNVDLGKTITVDEVTVAHNKREFIADFKKITPRFNVIPVNGKERVQEMMLNIEHCPLVISPELAKALVQVLLTEIQKYETSFGKIGDSLPENKVVSAGDQSYIG